MKRFKYTQEEFTEAVKRSFSIAGVCRALGLNPTGGNYRTIHKLIDEFQTDISHFTGQLWSKGKKLEDEKYHKNKIDLKEILETGRPYQSSKLAKRLISEGYKEHKCEMCGNTEWLGKPIPLELHHENGNHDDNHLTNLRLLCPNCHATTDTYRGSNIKHKKREREKVFDDTIYTTKNPYENDNIFREKKREVKKVKKELRVCEVCGKIIPTNNKKYCSVKCYRDAQKCSRPTFTQLIEDFKTLKSFIKVGKKYNVTDNAVRNWCAFYDIPIYKKELNIFISEL